MDDVYIRAQDAIDAVHEEFDGCTVWDESGKRTADEVESIIDRIPPADVVPVVRKWEIMKNNDAIKCPEDKITYAVICKNFPNPTAYFESYDLAKRWVKLEQPNNRPFYIVKRIEHFEFCDNGVELVEVEEE